MLETSAAGRIEIQHASQISESALATFYNTMYPEKAEVLKAAWRWLYRVGQFDFDSSPVVAVSDGRVVGHAGMIPVTLRRNDEEHTAIWFVDFGILPEYRRQGFGGALTAKWMAACPNHVTFCNEKALGVFVRFGWQAQFHTESFRLYLWPERRPGLQESPRKRAAMLLPGIATRILWRVRSMGRRAISVSDATPEAVAALIDSKPISSLHAPRSAQFLDWYVIRHPLRCEYRVLNFRGGGGVRYSALVRIYDRHGYRRLHILTVRSDSVESNELSSFFASIIGWAIKEEIHNVWLVASDPTTMKIARRWFPLHSRLRFASHSTTEQGKRFLGGVDHLWEAIDSDFDLEYG